LYLGPKVPFFVGIDVPLWSLRRVTSQRKTTIGQVN